MTTTVRKPLRTVAGTAATTTTTTATTTTAAATTTRRTRSTTAAVQLQQPHPPPQPEPEPSRTQRHRRLEAVKEEPAPDNLMSVDPHPPVASVPSPRRFVAAREAAASRHSTDHPRIPRRAHTRNVARYEEVDAEAERAFKKRRTSSDAPDVEALHEAEVEHAVIPSEEIEADPNGDEWDDLDADDADDPLMVSEYVTDIFEYLKEVEQTTMPNPNYMDNQKDLTWKMRGILNDWLIQVHSRFRLLPETLFLCINLVDRFLSARVVSLVKLQLVGITCLFIAAKVEEIVAPSASNFIYCAEASYDENDILQAERYVLKTIGWNVNYPNPMHFLRRISKADDYNVQVRTVAKFLLELQCVEWRLVAAPPSLLAAAAVWLARIILGFPDWTPNLAHYSSYPESALVPTANLMLNYLLKPASVFVREWAVEHWGNVRHVSLPDELPALKALIREALAREEALAQQDLADVGEYFEQ
ncbi:G2/mitotic-specific cyclin cdc13 [Grifola frondosa]|uniref:G2/mitotic-specific cyclin cdc13 n=1 Tax=Grifola frondosa TaxID=5627 RepID=A0A1C7MKN3_GRIFR|nr:G2/mitotic-specific cyclin cdc13 [Grifola frondosa]